MKKISLLSCLAVLIFLLGSRFAYDNNVPIPEEYGIISDNIKMDSSPFDSSSANGLIPGVHYALGDKRYIYQIKVLSETLGIKAALDTVMEDVNKYETELVHGDSPNILRLYQLASYLIDQKGYIDEKEHYFRNKLNRAPNSLEELIELNSILPPKKRWRLMPIIHSLYHMQGKDGEYNLKFISSDGFCEAVYNKEGILLTEKNDPVNMGTFNYAAGIHELNSHTKYDVTPYLKWGNSGNSPQKGKSTIQKCADAALSNYRKHSRNVLKYRKKILNTGVVEEL